MTDRDRKHTEPERIRFAAEQFRIRISESIPLGEGHINETFRVVSGEQAYILQRLSDAMGASTGLLEHNAQLYEKACDMASSDDWYFPRFLKTGEGKLFFTDEERGNWRMYPEIPGEVKQSGADPFVLGEGLAKLHGILDRIGERPVCALDGYRDIKRYYGAYQKLLSSAGAEHREREIETMIDTGYDRYSGLCFDGDHVIHGDTKQSNALFRDGKVIAWIDLDTLMSGARIIDIADALRSLLSGFVPGDGNADRERVRQVVTAFFGGYRKGGGNFTGEDCGMLPGAMAFLYLILGIRYYNDHLSGGMTFHGHGVSSCEKALRNLKAAEDISSLLFSLRL